MILNQLSSSETTAEVVWNHYNSFYNNFVFSSLYGLRSSSCASMPYETFNCLTLPVPEVDIHVKVNVFISVPCIFATEQKKEGLKYKEIAQKSVVCILEPQSMCENLYDQMAETLNKSKTEIDLILCCRESRVKVVSCDFGEF